MKSLNDAHGHLAGAEAVRTVGHIIRSRLPPASFACRYGGDEFVIALPGHSASSAGGTACVILELTSTSPVLDRHEFPPGTLSVSVGVACLDGRTGGGPGATEPDDDGAGEALFRAADAALYEAKRGGGGRVCVA